MQGGGILANGWNLAEAADPGRIKCGGGKIFVMGDGSLVNSHWSLVEEKRVLNRQGAKVAKERRAVGMVVYSGSDGGRWAVWRTPEPRSPIRNVHAWVDGISEDMLGFRAEGWVWNLRGRD